MIPTWTRACSLPGQEHVPYLDIRQEHAVSYLDKSMFPTWKRACSLSGQEHVPYLDKSMLPTGQEHAPYLDKSMLLTWTKECFLLGQEYAPYLDKNMFPTWTRESSLPGQGRDYHVHSLSSALSPAWV